MGLRNGNAIFQRVMEEVLSHIDFADAYVDDVIVGSTADNFEDLLKKHDQDLRVVFERLKEAGLVVNEKAQLFVQEVKFCGHILRDGQRFPAPDKLLPIENWEMPKTLTQLRGFLGLCNYYEEYVPNYAQWAWRLMEKLKVKGKEAKAGSHFPLTWDEEDHRSFEALKKALVSGLSLWQVEPDQPYQLRSDASHTAVGAVLEQLRDPGWVPVCFFSRKLTPSQVNWSPREKEAYAIVASLVKWAGWIGTSPVTVVTDHKSLESWIREFVQTPSGPSGRRARWHEVFSQFNLEICYQPGKTNVPADAMSRFAYPASQGLQDVCLHGSAESSGLVKKMVEAERSCHMVFGLEGQQVDNWVSRASHEAYHLSPELRLEVLRDLGVEDADITIDLFASAHNTTKDTFIDVQQDAFTFRWDKLTEQPHHVLWANPPFSLMSKVVTKVLLEPCRMVLVAPVWHDQPWWKVLEQITVSRVYLPQHMPVYCTDSCDNPLPGPTWATAVSFVNTHKWSVAVPWQDVERWIKRACTGKTLEHVHSRIMVQTRSGNIAGEPNPHVPHTEVHEPTHASHDHVTVPPLTRFRFWDQLSENERAVRRHGHGHRPENLHGRGHRPENLIGHGHRPENLGHRPENLNLPDHLLPEEENQLSVLDLDWSIHYEQCQSFQQMWLDTQGTSPNWPKGVQVMGGKLFQDNKLCVPGGLVHKFLKNFHRSAGHLGVEKSLVEVYHRFHLPQGTRTRVILEEMRKHCVVCQKAAPPHFPRDGQRDNFPVPERVMHSVCLDIFALPPTTWQGETFDCILLCVDRLSGWIVACPTQKVQLTAEKCAHLLLDRGWEPFGIPTTVHSDRGPQFVGKWFATMCARLGIQVSTSQPHRPRANGKAERAGQQLLSVLQKLHIEGELNWVQALPRALRIFHDTVGVAGLSPYNILFGRDRGVQGIPYTPQRFSEDSQDFFDRMEAQDRKIAELLEGEHRKILARDNQAKTPREPFEVGDLVWLARAPSLSSEAKVEPRWTGPLEISKRTGERSYEVLDKKGVSTMAHVDQLKKYFTLGESQELAGLENWDREISHFEGSRERGDGEAEYLAVWADSKGVAKSWLPVGVVYAMGAEQQLELFLQQQAP